MLRVILSFFLVLAFTGASLASVMHGVSHGSDHTGHHADMAHNDLPSDAEQALAECCDAASGKGPATRFGDLLAGVLISPIAHTETVTGGTAASVLRLSGLTRAVPTGPPKV